LYTNSDVEHVSNSGTTLWNLGKEGKEKKKTHHIKGLVEWLKKENITSLSS
jgi:hypothetical protein